MCMAISVNYNLSYNLSITYIYVTIIACLYSESLPLYKINNFFNIHAYILFFSVFFFFSFPFYFKCGKLLDFSKVMGNINVTF